MGAVVGVVGVLGRSGVGVRCEGRSQCCSSSPGRQGMRALKHSGGRRDQQRCPAGAAGCSGERERGWAMVAIERRTQEERLGGCRYR